MGFINLKGSDIRGNANEYEMRRVRSEGRREEVAAQSHCSCREQCRAGDGERAKERASDRMGQGSSGGRRKEAKN